MQTTSLVDGGGKAQSRSLSISIDLLSAQNLHKTPTAYPNLATCRLQRQRVGRERLMVVTNARRHEAPEGAENQ